ncbi:MAG TPA: hypothetical protein VG056_09840 [Pirellulales bacterium]|jgi:hypothetical protein|nr:hypothetical protein [Pirellulales bacterium]
MDNRDASKQWVEHWKRVGPILEKVRHDELRAMTDEQAARACESLFEFALAAPSYQVRKTSGFVEQQRLFLKLRTRIS